MERLVDRDAFRRLRSDGTRQRGSVVSIVARTGPESTAPAVGFAIPRKVGNSVTRNRIRRRVREVFRSLERDGALPAGDYLVLPSSRAAHCDFGELRSQVAGLVERHRIGAR